MSHQTDSILWLMEFNKHSEYGSQTKADVISSFLSQQNAASARAVKSGCVCFRDVWVQIIPTITSDTGPSGGFGSAVIQSDATVRDKNVFAELLYLPEGWNWHLLCCYLYCCLLLLFNGTFVLVSSVSLSQTSQSVSELSGLSPVLSPSHPPLPHLSLPVCVLAAFGMRGNAARAPGDRSVPRRPAGEAQAGSLGDAAATFALGGASGASRHR